MKTHYVWTSILSLYLWINLVRNCIKKLLIAEATWTNSTYSMINLWICLCICLSFNCICIARYSLLFVFHKNNAFMKDIPGVIWLLLQTSLCAFLMQHLLLVHEHLYCEVKSFKPFRIVFLCFFISKQVAILPNFGWTQIIFEHKFVFHYYYMKFS